MGLWNTIRGWFRRSEQVSPLAGTLSQADLRPGEPIRAEPLVHHSVIVTFPRSQLDDDAWARVGDRVFWTQLLAEDRAAATRDDRTLALDEMLLAMLQAEKIVAFMPPQPSPRAPLDSLPFVAEGYNEPMLDLAERCDTMLGFTVFAVNDSPARIAWPLAHHLARIAARETEGLIVEHHAERWWTLERWSAVNPYPGQGWIGNWVLIHSVCEGAAPAEFHTHGMLHFGLPDVELTGVPRAHGDGASKLINAVCQALIRRVLDPQGGLTVGEELEITSQDVSDANQSPDAERYPEGKATIRLVPGDPAAALVSNRLLRIVPAARYGTGSIGLSACLHELFPEPDEVRSDFDEQAMQAAHAEALRTLPDERERFRKGLRPGERLAVKVPFTFGEEDDAREHMWVEVHQWTGEGDSARLVGVLLNEPLHCTDLKLGQPLTVRQGDVYDWMRVTRSGRQEGNFTSKVFEQEE